MWQFGGMETARARRRQMKGPDKERINNDRIIFIRYFYLDRHDVMI